MGRRDLTWSGEVLGTAGGGLSNASWAANEQVAKVGRIGELRTAEVLDPLARSDGFTILHDLRIPIPGFTANIDHVVVAGSDVLLIDTKAWKAGRYWTFAGTTRRGVRRFAHAATKTPGMAHDTILRFLDGRGIQASLPQPLVVVWPSSRDGKVSVGWLKMDRCRPIVGAALASRVRRLMPRKPASPAVVAALRDLINDSGLTAPARPLNTRSAMAAARSGPVRVVFGGESTPATAETNSGLPAGSGSFAELDDESFGPAAPTLDAHPLGVFDGDEL